MTTTGTRVFFDAPDDASGRELWTSNGNAAGTLLVKDIRPGIFGSLPSNLTAVGTKLFFSANDGTQTALWVTDGTGSGTTLLSLTLPTSSAAAVGDIYYFAGTSDSIGIEL